MNKVMNQSTEETDEVLFARVREGSMAAFDTLYQRHESRLLSFIHRILGNVEESEDVFHETFMAVLKSREILFDRATFKTWLYQIARNISLNRLRSRSRAGKTLERIRLDESDLSQNSIDPEEWLEAKSLTAEFFGAVAELPAPQLEMYSLRAAGLSYDEMARLLEIPLGTVKTRMQGLIHRLRKELKIWTSG